MNEFASAECAAMARPTPPEAPVSDPAEQTAAPPRLDLGDTEQDERILFGFVRDAPRLPTSRAYRKRI